MASAGAADRFEVCFLPAGLRGDAARGTTLRDAARALGLEIESRSPWQPTAVVELANGWEGYLPTARAFAEGGYETLLARSSKLARETAEAVVEKAGEVLRSV